MTNVSQRPYGPSGFTVPLNGHEQPYVMPTSFMAGLYNSTSTFSEPIMNVTWPLQGSGSDVNNMGRISQPFGT